MGKQEQKIPVLGFLSIQHSVKRLLPGLLLLLTGMPFLMKLIFITSVTRLLQTNVKTNLIKSQETDIKLCTKLLTTDHVQDLYIIRCLLLKYWLKFLQVLKAFDEPLGKSDTEKRVKMSVGISEKVPNNILIIKS